VVQQLEKDRLRNLLDNMHAARMAQADDTQYRTEFNRIDGLI